MSSTNCSWISFWVGAPGTLTPCLPSHCSKTEERARNKSIWWSLKARIHSFMSCSLGACSVISLVTRASLLKITLNTYLRSPTSYKYHSDKTDTYFWINFSHHEVVERLKVLRSQIWLWLQLFWLKIDETRIGKHNKSWVPHTEPTAFLSFH